MLKMLKNKVHSIVHSLELGVFPKPDFQIKYDA